MRYIDLPTVTIDRGRFSKRVLRWFQRKGWRRSVRYCHHEQPCMCGKPKDPSFTYEWTL